MHTHRHIKNKYKDVCTTIFFFTLEDLKSKKKQIQQSRKKKVYECVALDNPHIKKSAKPTYAISGKCKMRGGKKKKKGSCEVLEQCTLKKKVR